ncbi:hypothetical protein B0H19DRAFT_1273952 [Mycena capillaripes]|nr:hypothetical protein B0H19DRAFT_1273952 [Mycena capillaripes]
MSDQTQDSIQIPESTQNSIQIQDTNDALQSNSASFESVKRKRNSESVSPPRDSLRGDRPPEKRPKSSHRHVKHWDLEGDFFLRINDCWMRLRKSGLSKHSEWFSDIFTAIEAGRLTSDPKRPYMEGTIILVDVKNVQRCYHVPALGVSATDFGLLLTALDDAISYCHAPPAFPVISAILRNVALLTHRALDRRYPHATETVIMGRAWGVSGVLKRSLYELLRTPGFGQDNEDDLTRRPAPYEHSRLLPADILCLVNAREQLDLVWHAATAVDVFAALDEHDGCTPVRYATYRRLVHDTGLFQNYRFDVLCGLEMLAQIDWESESMDAEGCGVCALCVSKLREKWETDREQAWGKLDALFRLEDLGV